MKRKEATMKKTKKSMWIFLLAGFNLLCVATNGCTEMEQEKMLSPYFLVEDKDTSTGLFPLEETNVTVNISGVIAEVVVRQTYTNNGTQPLSARYIFPGSTRAAVHGMTMTIGNELITAKIKERNTAQQIFDTAKKQGKSASLLKQQRPNVFSMNVANIMPDTSVLVELRYTELLVPTEGQYTFVYPTVAGPRYSGKLKTESQAADPLPGIPFLKESTPSPTRFNIRTHLSTGIPLQEVICTSHTTHVQYENDSVAHIRLENPDDFGGDRDYILTYRLAGETIESGLMLYEGETENFFLLIAEPPRRVLPVDIPGREYVFVVDVSGSMYGYPLNTSKLLIKNLIGALRPTDTFNVMLFSAGSRILAPSSVPANTVNVKRAIRMIENARGGGGTELYAAVRRALDMPCHESDRTGRPVSRSIVILTDGYISAEKEVFELIHHHLNRSNVFAFGIGRSVNRYLIEGLATAGMGEPFIVTKPEEAGRISEQFNQYIQSPVLTRVTVAMDNFKAYDLEPLTMPDMFAQRPVVLFGKYRERTNGTIEITGQGGSEPYSRSFRVSDTAPLDINHPLKYLWARARLSRLSDFNCDRKDEENKEEITRLGISYNLLTPYTSFVAVRDMIVNPDGESREATQPLPLPKDVSELAVGDAMASVPEPELWMVAIALMIAVAVSALFKRKMSLRYGGDLRA